MQRKIASLTLWLFINGVQAAVLPKGSRFDSRMQQVSYNADNTTVINTRVAFLSTLLFDDEEVVLDARTGTQKGWDVQHEANRVYITPVPVTQTEEVMGRDGNITRLERVYEPSPENWTTNLFVVTTRRYYSMELRVNELGKTAGQQAYVVNYSYPQEDRKKAEKRAEARQKEMQQVLEQKNISKALENSQAPRNWEYFMQPGKNSGMIIPDFAYDDGRFTYLGFSPVKKFPAAFLFIDGREQIVNSTVEQKGNYKVLVIQQVSPSFVLRYGNAVIGIVNKGFGRVKVRDGNTVSPQVERVEKKE